MKMQTKNVNIGGVDYVIKQLTIRKSQGWRESVEKPLDTMLQSLSGAGEIPIVKDSENSPLNKKLDLSGIADLMQRLKSGILGSMDFILDMVCAYSPEIAADRERIVEVGYDDEIMAAYPFGPLLNLANRGQRGQTT
jgi:hypothetical protein